MNQKVTEEVFAKMQEIPENKVCFECEQGPANWASVNNGILLCLNCSGIHRSYGVNISFVRSVSMDSWSEKQLNYMIMGGNNKLKHFFESYDIQYTSANQYKFKTKAAQYYRDQLKAQVENSEMPVPPPYEEALKQIEVDSVNANQQNMSVEQQFLGNNNPVQKNEFEQFADKTKMFFIGVADKTTQLSKETYQKAKDKYNDPKTQQDLKDFGDKTKKTATELGQKTSQYAQKGWSFMKTGVLDAYDSIKKATEKKK